jgi:hypothetical protein
VSFDILAQGSHILKSPAKELTAWMRKGMRKRREVFGSDLFCFSPTGYPYEIDSHSQKNPHNFVSLSITGLGCSLNCEHCRGRLLKGMEATPSPEELFSKCQEIENYGGEGVLISGGSDSRGHVPLAPFVGTIARIKNELDLKVVVHTGLVSPDVARGLTEADIDAAMLDVIGSDEVAMKVYHLDNGVANIERSIDLLTKSGIPIAPHILIGLNYGELGGELAALEMIAKKSPAAVVFIILNPLRKTPMEHVKPPAPDLVGRILTIARHGLPRTPLLLGCARPMGDHKIQSDKYAIQSGINGIAYISQEGVDFSKKMGLNPIFSDTCCSLAPVMIGRASA